MNEKNGVIRRFFSGVITGVFAGGIVCLYRCFMTLCERILTKTIFPWIHNDNRLALFLWCVGLVVLAFIVHMIIRWEPNAKGGGLAHAISESNVPDDTTWDRIIIGKLIAAPLCILAGFSFGKTGPAIELGAMTGKGIASTLHKLEKLFPFHRNENISTTEYIRSGSAAGLSSLFNAPIAGVLFVYEKMTHNGQLSLFSLLPASITAFFVSRRIYGHSPIIIAELPTMDIKYYIFLAFLGIALGILGKFYAGSLTAFAKKLSSKNGFIQLFRWTLAFILAGFVGYYLPEITGGGSQLLTWLSTPNVTLTTLLFFIGAKYLFSMISSGSGLPGGTVFPLLSVGACLGYLFAFALNLLIPELHLAPTDFILPGMAGFFASVINAPLTGIFLLCEFSCDYHNALPLAVTCFLSYFIANRQLFSSNK